MSAMAVVLEEIRQLLGLVLEQAATQVLVAAVQEVLLDQAVVVVVAAMVELLVTELEAAVLVF
jgi:hypothetical protein